MFFLKAFYRSLFDTMWLREQRLFVGRAWSYAILMIAIVGALQILPVVMRLPEIFKGLQTAVVAMPDFTAHIENDQLRVEGLPQPYRAAFGSGAGTIELVVDTVSSTTPSIATIVTSSANVVLITARDLTFYDQESGSTQVQSFAGMSGGAEDKATFSKADVVKLGDRLVQIGPSVLGALIVFFFAVALVVGKILYLLVIAAIVYWATRARRNGWTFGQVFTVGLFALTLPTLIATIEFWLSWPMPFLYTFVLVLILVLTIRQPAAPAVVGPAETKPAPTPTE